jgi:hypothetical protein
MSDWQETRETDEQTRLETVDARITLEGVQSVQGEVDEHPEPDDDLATVHPRDTIETLPNTEVEPITIRNPEGTREGQEAEDEGAEGRIQTPEGWRPGGPELGM